MSFRRFPRIADPLILSAYGVVENFGYRQLTTCRWVMGMLDYFRGRTAWGATERKGFDGR